MTTEPCPCCDKPVRLGELVKWERGVKVHKACWLAEYNNLHLIGRQCWVPLY